MPRDIVKALEELRLEMETGGFRDGDLLPEDGLFQFVYLAITEFIEHDKFRLVEDLIDDEYDHDAAVLRWMRERWATPA